MDPSTRLGCCNLSVPWSKWWSQSWSIQGGGNPTQHKVQWVKVPSGSGGSSQVPPLEGSFTLFDAALWLICCPLVEGPRIESEVFGGLWPLVRHGCSYSDWGSWASDIFSEGMNTSRPMCECPHMCLQFYATASGVREDIGMIKSIIIPAPQDLLLINLFPNLAQKKISLLDNGRFVLGILWWWVRYLGCSYANQRFHHHTSKTLLLPLI